MTTIFTSHGAPDIIASDNATTRFWRQLGERFTSLQRIVVVSAHWCTATARIGTHPQPPTVHDFGGFAESLYQLHYPARGDADYARHLAQQLRAYDVQLDAAQGLDHGAWIPLLAMRPQADCAVIPLSLPMSYSLEQLWQFGAALRNVLSPTDLLLCSGASSHNLRALFSRDDHSATRVEAFRQWLISRVLLSDREALIDYRHQATDAVWNHPTDEHLRPLFIALGAAQGQNPEHYLSETTYRILPMDHFIWS